MATRTQFFDELDKYIAKYGPETCLFMQVGKFYECYGTLNEDGSYRGNMKQVADITGLNIGRYPMGGPSDFMVGMQIDYIGRFLPKLTEAGWTVVVMDQKAVGGKKFERVVSNIYTPGTYIHSGRHELLYTTILWFGTVAASASSITVGGATVDLARGTTSIMQTTCAMTKGHIVLDEVRHFLQGYPPQEVVVFVPAAGTVVEWITSAIASLNITCKCTIRTVEHSEALSMMRKDVQESVYSSVYPACALTPHQQLGLVDKPAAAVAFMHLLCHCKERVSSIVKYLQIPSIRHTKERLEFGNNALEQLHIISTAAGQRKTSSLLSYLNVCRTAIGRRHFMTRLLHPITDVAELEHRYDIIGAAIECHEWLTSNIVPLLARTADVEKLHRRISLGCSSVVDWLAVHNTYTALSNISELMNDCAGKFGEYWMTEQGAFCDFDTYLKEFDTYLDWEQISASTRISVADDDEEGVAATAPLPSRMIQPGHSAELDKLFDEITAIAKQQSAWAAAIGLTLNLGTVYIKATDKEGYKLSVTNSRWKNRAKATSIRVHDMVLNVSDIGVKVNTSVTRLTFKQFEELSSSRRELETQIAEKTTELLLKFAERLTLAHMPMWQAIHNAVAWIDVNIAAAGVADQNDYCRPHLSTVEDGDDSFINAIGLRHPLIEVLNTRTPYVANDVGLGAPSTQNGMLLYGLNAAGKSSLMKAVGCAVVMAQAGFYVPAREMHLGPYKYIFTRILNQDNMFQGLSSFAVEVTELRNILHYANPHTLVLGDELCSGTESTSATAIVAAGIELLAKHRASFIFATHLHALSELSEIKELPNVKIWHLHVERDPVSGNLLYTRTLQEGPGSSVYGLEVCRSMDMPDMFMDMAEKYRKRIMGEVEPWKVGRSRYNARVRMTECGVCGGAADEAHHIVPQVAAKGGKIVGRGGSSANKNTESNIVPLCEKCHDEHHSGHITINGWVATSGGRKLQWQRVA